MHVLADAPEHRCLNSMAYWLKVLLDCLYLGEGAIHCVQHGWLASTSAFWYHNHDTCGFAWLGVPAFRIYSLVAMLDLISKCVETPLEVDTLACFMFLICPCICQGVGNRPKEAGLLVEGDSQQQDP